MMTLKKREIELQKQYPNISIQEVIIVIICLLANDSKWTHQRILWEERKRVIRAGGEKWIMETGNTSLQRIRFRNRNVRQILGNWFTTIHVQTVLKSFDL